VYLHRCTRDYAYGREETEWESNLLPDFPVMPQDSLTEVDTKIIYSFREARGSVTMS